MQREIQLTGDGSHTISIPEMNVTYHSKHGALQESRHVFLEAGLIPLLRRNTLSTTRVLEIGLGTGLNALLSWQAAREYQKPVSFISIEPYPLLPAEAAVLNHGLLLGMQPAFMEIHHSPWEQENQPDPLFSFTKLKTNLADLPAPAPVHCIFFDAFDPVTQPLLWTEDAFKKMLSCLQPGGILLTYCSKSIVRHAMTAAGFRVEKIPGPRGKREMVRAWRD